MDCKRIREYLYSYIDGQLDSQTNLLVEEHLSICPICSLDFQEEKKFNTLIRQNIPKEEAPFTLKETVLKRIEEPQKAKVFPFIFLRLRPALTMALTALLLFTAIMPTIFKKNESLAIFSESILNHIKFLQRSLPLEITSDDPQEIKNWFQGKLSFAIMIPDFSQKGVNLIGGRLCHLKGREVAYLVYNRNGHHISVFVMDTKGFNIPKRIRRITQDNKDFFIKSERGYQSTLCLKKESDIGCIFVSDLGIDELIGVLT